ncbi:MAG: hypothetical protein JST69_12130 [Bacteroidetes bacterium]|nr:hypothetical protein [Bacteroidota bacterium]
MNWQSNLNFVRNPTEKIFLLLFLCAACSQPLPTFKNIDLAQWREDKNGCQRYRLNQLRALELQLPKIKGLTENDILKLFGKPDQTELWKRNQKFFYYFVEPSAKCDSANPAARKLSIRFNAMERAKEVEIE